MAELTTEYLDQKLAEQTKDLKAFTESQVEDLAAMIQNSVVEPMEKRFEAIDQRFESIDQRFESIDQRFESIDQRFESIDRQFETMNGKFEKLENALSVKL